MLISDPAEKLVSWHSLQRHKLTWGEDYPTNVTVSKTSFPALTLDLVPLFTGLAFVTKTSTPNQSKRLIWFSPSVIQLPQQSPLDTHLGILLSDEGIVFTVSKMHDQLNGICSDNWVTLCGQDLIPAWG